MDDDEATVTVIIRRGGRAVTEQWPWTPPPGTTDERLHVEWLRFVARIMAHRDEWNAGRVPPDRLWIK